MALNSDAVLDAAESALARLGVFERVNMHEPQNAPGNGITASVWVDLIRPIPKASGLAATSALVVLSIRCQTSLIQEPQNGIDRGLLRAVDVVMNALSGDFDLGGTVSYVDLLGAHGQPLAVRGGYLQQDDGPVYRVMNITAPLVIHDVWNQEA